MNGDGGAQLGWPELIGFAIQVRQQLADARPQAYPMTLPRVAASPADVDEAERRLGTTLDPAHRGFLLHADGWPDFFQGVALLGCHELGRGELDEAGHAMIDTLFEDGVGAETLPPRAELVPIAVSVDSSDIHVLWTGGTRTPGGGVPVLWLAGEEIDRWPDFTEYFRSMYTYLERALSRASG